MFSDAVHPEYQGRPAHGWFPKDQMAPAKTTSGRDRLNIQGTPDPETLQLTSVEDERINAETIRQMLERIERNHPTQTGIPAIPVRNSFLSLSVCCAGVANFFRGLFTPDRPFRCRTGKSRAGKCPGIPCESICRCPACCGRSAHASTASPTRSARVASAFPAA